TAVQPLLDTFRLDMRLSGVQRVTEKRYDFVGVRFRPQDVQHLVEITAYQVADLAEDRERDRVCRDNPEGIVDQVDAQRSRIQQALELRARLLHTAMQFGRIQQGA